MFKIQNLSQNSLKYLIPKPKCLNQNMFDLLMLKHFHLGSKSRPIKVLISCFYGLKGCFTFGPKGFSYGCLKDMWLRVIMGLLGSKHVNMVKACEHEPKMILGVYEKFKV